MTEQIIHDFMINPVTKQLFWGLVSAGIFFYIMMIMHNYICTIIALRCVTSSFRISKNCKMRFRSHTNNESKYDDGILIEIDRRRVVIEFEETIMSIPTTKFVKMDWNIVKS